MTTQPSNDSKCRRVFEWEYGIMAEGRTAAGEYRDPLMQIAWTNFRYGWMARERAND